MKNNNNNNKKKKETEFFFTSDHQKTQLKNEQGSYTLGENTCKTYSS